MEVYSIYDKKAQTYSLPFYVPSAEVACRVVVNAMIVDKRIDFYVHAEDYSVRHLGSFDQISGEFTSSEIVNVKTCEELAVIADKLREKVGDDKNV